MTSAATSSAVTRTPSDLVAPVSTPATMPVSTNNGQIALSDRHLLIGRTSVSVASVALSKARQAHPSERWWLDEDYVVVPLQTRPAELEWAMRGSELSTIALPVGSLWTRSWTVHLAARSIRGAVLCR